MHQGRTREVAAADRRFEDTAVLRPRGAHLHRVFHRVLRSILTMEAPGRFLPPDSVQEPPEHSVSGEDLRQAEGEDAVASLLKEGTLALKGKKKTTN